VTRDDLRESLTEYRGGLEAEIALLEQLVSLAQRQQAATDGNDYAGLAATSERRDELMRALLVVETQMKAVRAGIARHAADARGLDGFAEIALLHRRAEAMVATILTSDRTTVDALQAAEHARRTASAFIEAGEATLAAYRKVIAPPIATAGLVSKRG
jgi:hypothetical protein